MLTVHVVSHTHWDREWYHPAERFRQRLVALIDELLDDPDDDGSVLLDGQAVVLEDYLDVRPERASELAASLRDGRLEAGPWFVLADELIPGGEGLVRNLLAGRASLRALRAESPPCLYCPDSFGHPAALPMLARGFGKNLVIVWRGFGGHTSPRSNVVRWRSPDGESALVYHLSRSGYELGSSLPNEPGEAQRRWRGIRNELRERAESESVLLLNGADHHALQRHAGSAIGTLSQVAAPDEIRRSSITAFVQETEARTGAANVPEVHGELRDSYGYTWTLQGTLASRAQQKRRYARAERGLVRDVEPWTALVAWRGGASRRHLTRAAWRELLLCQPHDTLCGCSIDAVARAMDGRLASVASQSAGLREDSILELISHDREAARATAAWTPVLLLRNPSPRNRSGVAIVELTAKMQDVPVGPGSARVRRGKSAPARGNPVPAGAQVLETARGYELTESPRSYPDNDAVLRTTAAVWVDQVPAYGITAFPLSERKGSRSSAPSRSGVVRARGRSLSNGRLRLDWSSAGEMTLTHDERRVRPLIAWESRRDVGDLYTPSIRARKFQPRVNATRVLHRGPLRGVVEQSITLARSDENVDMRLRYILDAGAGWIQIHVLGDNMARDHRLRVLVNHDFRASDVFADAAFAIVERMKPQVPAAAARLERPVMTAPLHRYVSVFDDKQTRGATLFSDGLAEYESLPGALAVTLLRCVGELSRNDLPERPGHAGWPASTPEGQCDGPFEARLALMLHGPRSDTTIDEIERAADDVLCPVVGATLRSALTVPEPVHGVALEGAGLAFSCAKESEEDDWLVLRCVNLLDRESAGAWRLGRPVREARLARLDETPITRLESAGDRISFLAPPRATVTILVR